MATLADLQRQYRATGTDFGSGPWQASAPAPSVPFPTMSPEQLHAMMSRVGSAQPSTSGPTASGPAYGSLEWQVQQGWITPEAAAQQNAINQGGWQNLPANPSAAADPGFNGLTGTINQKFGDFPNVSGSLDNIGGSKFPRTADGFQAGQDLSNSLLFPGSMGRVVDAMDPALAEILTETRSNALGRTGYSQRGVDLLSANADLAGRRDPVLDAAIFKRQQELGGYTGAENQALREQGSEGMNRSLQTGLRAAGLQNASMGGVSGGIRAKAINPVLQSYGEANRGLERDLFTQNIAEKNRRQSELEGLVGGLSEQEANRRLQAFQGFGQANMSTEQFELGKLQDYRQGTFDARNDLLGRSQYNLGQAEKERTSSIDAILGLGSFGSALDSQAQLIDLGNRQIKAAGELKPLTSVSFGGLPGSSSFTYGSLPGMTKGAIPGQQTALAPGGYQHPGIQGMPLGRFY